MFGLYVIEQAGDHVLSKNKRTETKKADDQFRNAWSFFVNFFSFFDIKTHQCSFTELNTIKFS